MGYTVDGWMDGFALWFIAYTSLSRDSSEATLRSEVSAKLKILKLILQAICPPKIVG